MQQENQTQAVQEDDSDFENNQWIDKFIAEIGDKLGFEKREVFHFTPHDEAGNVSGPQMFFDVTGMREYVEAEHDAALLTPVEIRQQLYDHIMSNQGVEEKKIERLAHRPDIYCQPVLLIEWDDGSHVLVDGNHRFVILWRMGIRKIPAFVIPKATWERFVLNL